MNRSLVLSLSVALFAVIFTLQNKEDTEINFLNWTLEVPMALVIVIALLLGAIVAILMSIGSNSTKMREIKELRTENRDLKMRLKDVEYKRSNQEVIPPRSSDRPADPIQ